MAWANEDVEKGCQDLDRAGSLKSHSDRRTHDSKASPVAELELWAGSCGRGAALGSKWVKAQITFIYELM